LSVVRALRETLPGEEIVYLADTAQGPYASKSAGTIGSFTRMLLEQLRLFRPKHVAIVCDAAASAVMPGIRREFPDLCITSLIDATAKSAIEAAGKRETPLIGIIASEAGIQSKAYERAIHRRRHYARLLLRPTPLLDAIADEGRDENDPLVRDAVRQYLAPFIERGTHVLVMGSCWHSMLKGAVRRVLREETALVDSVECCAEDIARRLQAAGLLRGGEPSGAVHCLLTDDTPRFKVIAKRLLGREVESPKVIPLHELHRAMEQMSPMRVSA